MDGWRLTNKHVDKIHVRLFNTYMYWFSSRSTRNGTSLCSLDSLQVDLHVESRIFASYRYGTCYVPGSAQLHSYVPVAS